MVSNKRTHAAEIASHNIGSYLCGLLYYFLFRVSPQLLVLNSKTIPYTINKNIFLNETINML